VLRDELIDEADLLALDWHRACDWCR